MMSLTDEQLRHRLTDLGCDVGPIDDTTRPLYVSMLKRREADAKPVRQGRSSAAAATSGSPKSRSSRTGRNSKVVISSDEDEEEEDEEEQPSAAPRNSKKSTVPQRKQQQSSPSQATVTTNRRKRDSSTGSQSSVSSTMYVASGRQPSRDSSLFSTGLSPVRPQADSPPRNKYTRRPLHPPNYSYSGSNGFSDDENPPSTSRGNGSLFGSYSSRSRRRSPTGVRAPSHPISKLLIGVTAIFFCGLGLVYYRLVNPGSFSDQTEQEMYKYVTCTSQTGEHGINCIDGALVTASMDAVKGLQNILKENSYEMLCGAGTQVLDGEGTLPFDKASSLTKLADSVFNGALYLIEKNPQVGIEISKGETQNSLKLSSYSAPILCTLQRVVMKILYQVLLLIVFILLVVASYWAWQKRKTNQRERKRQINGFVEDITEMLTNNAADNPETPYLAILEIRNKLIPTAHNNRNALQLWKEVEEKFEATESTRVAKEKQRIRGEWFAVWGWLPPPNANGDAKVWQGKAFDGSCRIPPLTNCLKIRNMFNKAEGHGDGWMNDVKRAILDKCGTDHGITHISVAQDSVEGLVFARLVSLRAAGEAYHNLHGSWFDGRLITVKYLREERYIEKFPECVNYTEPMATP